MKHILSAVILALAPIGAVAQSTNETPADPPAEPVLEIIDGTEITLEEYLWTARPVVVFADSAADPRFVQQMELLARRPEDLAIRDVVVITDTRPEPVSDLRKELRPRGFMLVLIGKDGQIVFRKPLPWDLRELSRAIDKLPMRMQEVRDRR